MRRHIDQLRVRYTTGDSAPDTVDDLGPFPASTAVTTTTTTPHFVGHQGSEPLLISIPLVPSKGKGLL